MENTGIVRQTLQQMLLTADNPGTGRCAPMLNPEPFEALNSSNRTSHSEAACSTSFLDTGISNHLPQGRVLCTSQCNGAADNSP